MTKQAWVIYDERAFNEGTDKACVLEACNSLRDVLDTPFDGKDGMLGLVYEYDLVSRPGQDDEAINERFIGDVNHVRQRLPQGKRKARR